MAKSPWNAFGEVGEQIDSMRNQLGTMLNYGQGHWTVTQRNKAKKIVAKLDRDLEKFRKSAVSAFDQFNIIFNNPDTERRV